MSPTTLHNHLQQLESERMFASLVGLENDPAYMADLTDEITAARYAYVGAAVTEIAVLRSQLSGTQEG